MIESLQHWAGSVDWSFWTVWPVTTALMLAGLIGTLLPFVPGPLIVFIGGLAHMFLRPTSGLNWWGISIMAVLLVLAYVLDAVSGAAGSRWFGGSRWGVVGVLVGGVVGMFFGFFGLLLGPLIGAFAFEMLFAGKTLKPAARSTWGTVVGTGLGLIARFAVTLVMIGVFALNVWNG